MPSHQRCVAPQVCQIARLIEWVGSCCGADRVADDVTFKLTLAVEEAVSNAIAHAFADLPPPHLIKVRLEITAASVAAEIIDNGRPFDPTAAPDADLSAPLERRDPGGLGVHLMHSVMDDVQYRHSDGRNILRLEKARS